MSLSDYISIFDTRPIAQSHLTGAATATLCRHNATTQRRAATSALRSARGIEREREPWNTNGSPRQNRATPHRATPSRATRHATLRQAPSRPSRPPLSLSLSPRGDADSNVPTQLPPSSTVLPCFVAPLSSIRTRDAVLHAAASRVYPRVWPAATVFARRGVPPPEQ